MIAKILLNICVHCTCLCVWSQNYPSNCHIFQPNNFKGTASPTSTKSAAQRAPLPLSSPPKTKTPSWCRSRSHSLKTTSAKPPSQSEPPRIAGKMTIFFFLNFPQPNLRVTTIFHGTDRVLISYCPFILIEQSADHARLVEFQSFSFRLGNSISI